MVKACLVVAMVLGFSATTAIAESTSASQHVDAPTPMDTANVPQDPAAPPATDEEDLQQAPRDAQTTDPADSEPEPESIGGSSEP